MGTTYLRIITLFSLGSLGFVSLQFVSLFMIIVVFLKKEICIDLNIRYLKPEKQTLADIYSVGLPAIIMQTLTPVMVYALNLILGTISASAVTAYGVYYKLQNFIFMPGYGLIYISVIMLIGMVLLQFFARQIVGIFSVTEESYQLCVLALPIAWAISQMTNAANFIWLSLPVAEAGACAIAVLLTMKAYRKVI